jgi:hypothetical protein
VAEFYNVISPCIGSPKVGKRELKALVSEQSDGTSDDGAELIDVDVREMNVGASIARPRSTNNDTDPNNLVNSNNPTDPNNPTHPEEPPLQLSPLERLGNRMQIILSRIIAFIGAATMTWFGMGALAWGNVTQVPLVSSDAQVLAQGAAALAVGLATLLVPSFGIILALAALCFAVFIVVGIVPGIILALLCIAWWLQVGRVSKEGAIALSLVPLSMALFVPSAAAQLAGYLLSLKRALPTAVLSFVLAVATTALTGAEQIGAVTLEVQSHILYAPLDLLLKLLSTPPLWLTGLAWVAASVLVHAFARFGTRRLAFVGILLANVLQLVVLAWLPTLLNIDIAASQLLPQTLLTATTFTLMTTLRILGIPPYTPENKKAIWSDEG